MPTYALLNLITLSIVLGALRFSKHLRFDTPVVATCGLLLIFTAVFDSLMIDAGLFSYNPATLTGIYIWKAPVEDFFYALLAGILIPNLWRGKKHA